MSTTRREESRAVAFIKVKRQGTESDTWRHIGSCLKLVQECIRRNGGHEIKTITGDTLMCGFPDADTAFRASVAVQETLAADGAHLAAAGLGAAVGFAYGPMLIEAGDAFGYTVHLAARLAGEAKAGQVVTNAETARELSAPLRAWTRLIDHMPVKGFSEPIHVHEVAWGDDDATWVSPDHLRRRSGTSRLRLQYGDVTLVLDHTSAPVVLGRGSDVDLRVDEADVSRSHLRIEHRRGKFIVTDESVNGTFVETTQGTVRLRRRESTRLSGSGWIYMGRDPSTDGEAVHYQCEESLPR
jgi:hypothetical protein